MLGFDSNTLISELKTESPMVLDGTLGVIGSPYNPRATSYSEPEVAPENVQETQKTPKGTPSEGRPKGKVAKTPKLADKTKVSKIKNNLEKSNVVNALENLSMDELEVLQEIISRNISKKSEEDNKDG
jgi:hypothetical protein